MTIRQRPSHRDGERSTYQLIKALENFFPTGVIRYPYLSGMIYPRSINNLTVVRLAAAKDEPMIARASLVYGKPGGKSTFKTWPEGFIKPSKISCHFFSRRESPGNCCVFFIYFNVLHLTRPRQVEYKPKIQDYARLRGLCKYQGAMQVLRGYASTKVMPIPRLCQYQSFSSTIITQIPNLKQAQPHPAPHGVQGGVCSWSSGLTKRAKDPRRRAGSLRGKFNI